MELAIRRKRPLSDIENVQESENKANKKTKLHVWDTCPSLENQENQPEVTPPKLACRRVCENQAPRGLIQQLYDKLSIQQKKGKFIHIESHVEEIRKDLCKKLKISKQAVQTWGHKRWYNLFLEIKHKSCPEDLSQVKTVFSQMFEASDFIALIEEAVAERQAWFKGEAAKCPSKEDFI